MLIRVNVVEECDPNTSVGAGARDDDSSNVVRLRSPLVHKKITEQER